MNPPSRKWQGVGHAYLISAHDGHTYAPMGVYASRADAELALSDLRGADPYRPFKLERIKFTRDQRSLLPANTRHPEGPHLNPTPDWSTSA